MEKLPQFAGYISYHKHNALQLPLSVHPAHEQGQKKQLLRSGKKKEKKSDRKRSTGQHYSEVFTSNIQNNLEVCSK